MSADGPEMKYVDAFRGASAVRALADEIARAARRPWSIMEVCGGQTHAIMRFGLDRLLPPGLELLHGPGCPVCVTPQSAIEEALSIAAERAVIFCTFGDMMRVPSAQGDLARAKAAGADVRVVYSPLDAVEIARANPGRETVFFAVGFETTAPANAMAVCRAKDLGLTNFSLLVAQVLVPPALVSLLDAPDHRIDAFLAAGHVCTVMGLDAYRAIAGTYRVPIVATGFEPVDILWGILSAVRQLEAGEAFVENRYERAIAPEGNRHARALVARVFEPADRSWRGLGTIAKSGLVLREAYSAFDAQGRFGIRGEPRPDDPRCLCGPILQGRKSPADCRAFGKDCTPERPLGVTMVSSEGACAAYYQYREHRDAAP